MSDDGDDGRGHPGTGTTDAPTGDAGGERYRSGEAASAADGADEADERGFITRILDRVPEATVALGAGFLLTSTLITCLVFVFGLYSLVTGSYTTVQVGEQVGVPPAQVLLLVVTFGLSTVFQAVSVRWARRRTNWTWVMLACGMGTVSVVASPFALPAAFLLFVGKRHFTMSTPFWVIGGDDEDAA